MLRRLSVLAFLVVLVTCGSRTQTPDYDPYGQGGTSQGAGGVGVSVTGGSNNVAGSTTPGNLCGSTVCPAGSMCCPSCGICVSPDVPCPECFPGGAGGGFPGTGGTIYPGTGGFNPGTGGAGGCGPIGVCAAQLQSSCAPSDPCTCSACGCQAQSCIANPGCLAIYRCMTSNNCTSPSDCFQCAGTFTGNTSAFPTAMALLSCGQNSGCPRCARPVPAFDAGISFCSTPPPPAGGLQCSGDGQVGGGSTCSQVCGDGRTKYFSQCANGSCTCNYDGREICRCSYPVQGGCRSCCPPWGPVGLN